MNYQIFSPQRHSFPLKVCLAHRSKCILSEGKNNAYELKCILDNTDINNVLYKQVVPSQNKRQVQRIGSVFYKVYMSGIKGL